MPTLESFTEKGQFSTNLVLEDAIKTINDTSCMLKSSDKISLLNILKTTLGRKFEVTYNERENTPIIIFDTGIIFLGNERKRNGFKLVDVPTWKFIFYCDVQDAIIELNKLTLKYKKSGFFGNTEKEYIFSNILDSDIAPIAKTIMASKKPIEKLKIHSEVKFKVEQYKNDLQRGEENNPEQREYKRLKEMLNKLNAPLVSLSGSGRRKTKRAKKSKRRTRRS